MSIQTLRKQLNFYQRMMMVTKTDGDMMAHEVYKQITRKLTEQIQQNEKTICSQQTA